MNEKLISKGKCLYCGGVFTQQGIGKHLATHLHEIEKQGNANEQNSYIHVEVKAGEMFLHLLVLADLKMKQIDGYLRAIWLECCNHLSCFRSDRSNISMNKIVSDVYQYSKTFTHEYDFGDSTVINLKLKSEYHLNFKESIILLSRNEPLELLCALCRKEPAIHICTNCNYEEYSFFCKECSIQHEKLCEEFRDYSKMNVVNSPRMGVCGYTGGSIDLERDGTFKKINI